MQDLFKITTDGCGYIVLVDADDDEIERAHFTDTEADEDEVAEMARRAWRRLNQVD